MNTQTISAVSLVASLFNAIDAHQANIDALSVSFLTREQALKAFKDAGYTCVQDGRKKGKALKHEVPNNQELKDFFNDRFLKHCNEFYLSRCDKAVDQGKPVPEFVLPTETQISANLKQQISCLNYYLKTGTFTTNVGRDKLKNELDETMRLIFEAEKKAKLEAEKAKKAKQKLESLAKRQAEADAEALARAEAEAEAKLKAEAEAEALAKAEAEALAKALSNPTQTNKKALAKVQAEAKKQAEAEALAKAEADKLKAEAEALVKQIQAEALAKVQAEKKQAEAEAEAKRLKTEADKKAEAKKKPNKDDAQMLENVYRSAINNLTEVQIETLILKLKAFIKLDDYEEEEIEELDLNTLL